MTCALSVAAPPSAPIITCGSRAASQEEEPKALRGRCGWLDEDRVPIRLHPVPILLTFRPIKPDHAEKG